ncbi:MAG: AsmA-like C-terminal region-containing protein [Salibacteraceae bacterium]
MKVSFLKRRKFWVGTIASLLLLPVLLIGGALLFIYYQQDALVQSAMTSVNEEYQGRIEVGDVHLEPFDDFPYVSLKIDDVRVFETKQDNAPLGLEVADIYLGFNFWDILSGQFDVQSLVVEDGFFNIILHEDGTNNIQNALATNSTKSETKESSPVEVHLKKIELRNLDIHKLNEATHVDIETYIYNAVGGFKTEEKAIKAHIDSEFELNVINGSDTTYVKRKQFELHTDISIDNETGIIDIAPSGIVMEHGDFELVGSVATKNEVDLDLSIKGTKPNFDMLIAFAPHDLVPVLERYNNAGQIYFNAIIDGPVTNGAQPYIKAEFGADQAFLENTEVAKKVDDLGFKGFFTNGEQRNLETMEFSLTEMQANLEQGRFLGDVRVKNFKEPEIDMQLDADFNLDFLTKFLNLNDVEGVTGSVELHMKFNDIIDLDNPQKAIEELNRAYFAELKVTDLSLSSSKLESPLDQLNAHLIMKGKKAELDQFEAVMGQSDLSITGYLSDLPAIVHHTDDEVDAHLEISSKVLDIAELTDYSETDSTGVNERIEDFQMAFSFKSSAKDFTESEYLPKGEFFIDGLHAQLEHYPHELHDFHADILIDDEDLTIKDFTGYIDDSDFHFNGLIHDYGFWLQEDRHGDVDLDITLQSDLLRLEDVFSYGGENYVPEDYRHEEFDHLTLHLNSSMHFKDSNLSSIDLDLDKLDVKMHVHPMRLEDFAGHFHYEDDHLVVQDFHGQMGRTVFDLDLNYYLGEDPSIRKRDIHLALTANYIDFDQLTNFNTAPTTQPAEPVADHTLADVSEHAEAFNLYELPFTDMLFQVDVGHFIFHDIDLQQINAQLRTTEDHYIYIDTLDMLAADGAIHLSGYFNGSAPEHIYVKPKLTLDKVDIDKLLFKFERYGEDVSLSENLHGKLSATINGNIRVYPDFVPDLDQSEIHMDINVLNGRLVDFEPMLALSDYMGDKDLTNIRFDTLANHMDLTNGVMNIPNMTIESTLGHFDVSGQQDLDLNMEYYIRIPWKLIRQTTRNKLFSKKGRDENAGEDEIVEVDPNKRTRYLNLKLTGNPDDFTIKPQKDKRGK